MGELSVDGSLVPQGGDVEDGGEDALDSLANWPALVQFIDEMPENEAENVAQPPPGLLPDLALSRAHSLPAYLHGGRDLLPLSRHLLTDSLGGGLLGGLRGAGLQGGHTVRCRRQPFNSSEAFPNQLLGARA